MRLKKVTYQHKVTPIEAQNLNDIQDAIIELEEDADEINLPEPSNATPKDLGEASAGTSEQYSRSDHIHQKPFEFTDLGGTLIPSEPGYISYINPSKFIFSAEYKNNKNIFTCEVVSDGSGGVSVGFNSQTSSGFTPVDIRGKLVRMTQDPDVSHDNLMYIIRGISDDGTAYKNWSIDLNAQPNGTYVIDEYMFMERCNGYSKFFISGFAFASANVRTAGEVHTFTVEIASLDEVENGWTANERFVNINKKMQRTVYDFDSMRIKGINHRGYNSIAPENTLPAYRLSKQKGFHFVETDVMKTSDNEYVLLHDVSINRTARTSTGAQLSSTINIADITYEEALTYDFGIWKSNIYAGTKIPTFEQFICLCSKIGLYPYIELKSDSGLTKTDISNLVSIVKKYNMERRVSWISFTWSMLTNVFAADSGARIGWLGTNIPIASISTALRTLCNGKNEVFMDANMSGLTSEFIAACEELCVPLEVYGADTVDDMTALDDYVSGVTTDVYNFEEVILETNLGEENTGVV